MAFLYIIQIFVYGIPLKLSGEFFVDIDTDTNFSISKSRQFMQIIHQRPTRRYSRRSYFIFNNLFETTHVFVPVDHVKQSLERLYKGPYRVLKHILDNLCLTDYKGKEITISTDDWNRRMYNYTKSNNTERTWTYIRQGTCIVCSLLRIEWFGLM